jgi:tetratricopeptide (TPR) repeat protein
MENSERPIKRKWMLWLALGTVAVAGGYEVAGRGDAVPAAYADGSAAWLAAMDPAAGGGDTATEDLPEIEGFAGRFLASHYAQSVYDWKTAARFLDDVLKNDPKNFDLTKRAMVLEMGTGDTVAAARHAQTLLTLEPENGFAYMIIAVDALTRNDLEAALAVLTKMPDGDMTTYAKPLLLGWAEAGRGNLEISRLEQMPLHLYHGALMAYYLGKKDQTKLFIEQIMQVKGLTQGEALRVADMLAALGEKDKALGLYQGLRVQENANTNIDEKIAAVESGDETKMKAVIPAMSMAKVQQGAALSMYDLAFILFQEQSDSSTKLFAQMALAMDPELIDAQLLLAETLVRNERLDEAIAILRAMPETYPSYRKAQEHAANLLAEAGRQDEALALLDDLYKKYNDVETLVSIGDVYRRAEDYKAALKAYNRAVKAIGKDEVPDKYWDLLYARGMVNEREGNWAAAEKDLRAAMKVQPDHPYLLNYLGYSWADKGENLEESLALIRKAAGLRPMDGYITDSLGWVLYRMGKYEEAVPHLERAVELLPYDATINEHLGDAYWQVGRRLEARFQWRRAMNNGADEKAVAAMEAKLKSGLPDAPDVRSAESHEKAVAPAATDAPVVNDNKPVQ